MHGFISNVLNWIAQFMNSLEVTLRLIIKYSHLSLNIIIK